MRAFGASPIACQEHLVAAHECPAQSAVVLVAVAQHLCGAGEVDLGKGVECLLDADVGRLALKALVRAVGRYDAHAQNRGELRHGAFHLFGRLAVDLHDHDGDAAAPVAVQRHRADVDARLRQKARHMREHARFIVLPDDEARTLAGDVDGDPVHQAQLRRAAADGDASHAHAHAGCIHGLDVDGVGVVSLGEGVAHELKLEALRARLAEGRGDARVIGVHTEHACDQGFVGAMPLVGLAERPVQRKLDVHGLACEQAARHACDSQGSCGVRRRRSHHDGADDVSDALRFHRVSPQNDVTLEV